MAALNSRIRQLGRLARLSTWRFLALVATDPRWQPLYDSLAVNTIHRRFENPTPWFAWHSLELLRSESAQRSGQRVLEWGSGSSTLWFHRQGLMPTAIEHDQAWFEACKEYLSGKADLRLLPLGPQYYRPDVVLGHYSIIVIDGRERNHCAQFVCDGIEQGRLSQSTLIVFDDSNRERYQASLDRLALLCRRHKSFSGPTSVEIDKMTTFFWV